MSKPVRERMRDDFEEMYAEVKDLLRDAGEATKSVWVNCPHCKRKSQVEIKDAKAALDVARFFVEHGFGRAAVSEPDDREGFVFENKVVLVAEQD